MPLLELFVLIMGSAKHNNPLGVNSTLQRDRVVAVDLGSGTGRAQRS